MALLGRDTIVSGPLPDGVLLLETLHGREALGAPYRFDLSLLSGEPNIPVEKVLGQLLTVQIKLDSGELRYFNGIVTYFAKVGIAMRHTRYAAVLNPRLTLLDYAHDCRIFNDATNFEPDPEGKQCGQTALQIVTDVLEHRGVTELESGALEQHVYRDRKYCVQYRETDLNFVQRLLEEEGIYYFFKHTKGAHTMVLADSATAHEAAPGYESVPLFPKERKQGDVGEHFWSLKVAGSLFQGRYTVLRGYDYTQPRPKQTQFEEKSSSELEPGQKFEDYDYPGGLSASPDAKDEAEVRFQTDYVANTIIEVEGDTMGLGAGALVTLRKPLTAGIDHNPFWSEVDFTKKFLITSAVYSISIDQYETGDVAGADQPFKATYTLLDSQTPFRPQRTVTKPRIEGPQTAIVVGSSGDEIYTDKLGRVKVQFDWDRKGEKDQKSSCWIRVAQLWAGKQWGAMYIPRVGQEVIVEFMDGDPDRPIITGRVYNADNMPPYALPGNKTQSGIKSRSSKGGTDKNFNEIRFEDLKGKEELHIQAELDMSTNVKRNQTLYVGGDQSITIHGNQTISVHGTDEKTGKKLPIQSVTTVTGKHTFDASDTIKIQAPTSITLECGGSTIVMVPGSITLTAGGGAKLVLDANALTEASGGGKTLHDANVCHTSNAGAQVLLDANVKAASVPGAQIVLDANVAAQSVAGSKVVLDANAAMEGTVNASVKGAVEATLAGAAGSVKAGPAGAEVAGPKVDVNGQTMVSIAGAMVKIN
jgi:type VI secretion system secreted protein VgrG